MGGRAGDPGRPISKAALDRQIKFRECEDSSGARESALRARRRPPAPTQCGTSALADFGE